MNWMACWPGRFPVFAAEASRRARRRRRRPRVRRLLPRRHRRDDRATRPRRRSRRSRSRPARGISLMLPTEDSPIVGEELARRFGLPLWQIAIERDRREPLRAAARPPGDRTAQKILVFDWCYHGTVDETLVTLDDDGHVAAARGAHGPAGRSRAHHRRSSRSTTSTRSTRALAPGDVACRARRAGDDEHRDHPSRARLPRRAARAHPRGPARCSSSTRRTRSAPGPAATPASTGSSPTCSRSASRSRPGCPTAAYGMTTEVADRVRRPRRPDPTATSAASAARSPATRSRSPRCG